MLESIALIPLREDLSLQPAARGRDGAPQWNIFDPARNRFFRVGWLEFELLSRWRAGLAAADLCQAVHRETPLAPQEDDVLALLHFLDANELLRADSPARRRRLLEMAGRRKLSVWKWLLHHYLFIRIPLVKPDAFLARTLPWLAFVFRPSFFIWGGALALFGMARVADQWAEFSQTFMYFFSWQGAFYYGLALVLSKLVHELAHAYTARYYGLRVPTMGLAFIVLFPLLYTDTSEGWKLASRRQRLAIGGAGVVAELLLAGLAALAWSYAADGPLKSACYVLAAVTWISTLAVNLNPFMRFDGYYLLMDAVDIPNLQERSFAVGRWQLRHWLLGLEDDYPEPEYRQQRLWMLLYAYSTWLYRLVVFTGIAVVVYQLFFKLAGIVLFAVEIGWFVLRPIWNEGGAWWLSRERWQNNPSARRNFAALVLLFGLGGLLPWHSRIDGQGILEAYPHTRVFPPLAARVVSVPVHEGQHVHKGDVLFELASPDVDSRLRVAQSHVAGIEAQLAGSVGNSGLRERSLVLERELNAAQAEQAAAWEEKARLKITAEQEGIFRDLSDGLYPGAWIRQQRLLGRIVGEQGALAQIYVGEADIQRVRVGAHARLISRRTDASEFDAEVVAVDETATTALSEPALSSTHGGPIAVRQEVHGELRPNEAIYRVVLKVESATGVPALMPVAAFIDGEPTSLLLDAGRWLVRLVIREAGF